MRLDNLRGLIEGIAEDMPEKRYLQVMLKMLDEYNACNEKANHAGKHFLRNYYRTMALAYIDAVALLNEGSHDIVAANEHVQKRHRLAKVEARLHERNTTNWYFKNGIEEYSYYL